MNKTELWDGAEPIEAKEEIAQHAEPVLDGADEPEEMIDAERVESDKEVPQHTNPAE